jgi:hypothetical protein
MTSGAAASRAGARPLTNEHAVGVTRFDLFVDTTAPAAMSIVGSYRAREVERCLRSYPQGRHSMSTLCRFRPVELTSSEPQPQGCP